MPTLDDLPPYRRAKLLWELAHFGVAGVDQMVRERAGVPCRLSGEPKPSSPRVAVLGDDGRFHLMSDGKLLCAQGRTEQRWEHTQICSWTETSGGLLQGYRSDGTHESVAHTWLAQAADEGVPSTALRPEQRCQSDNYTVTMHYWPPLPARTAPVRRMRAALVEALGPDCHLCDALPGAMVDHDYSTGMVRGPLTELTREFLQVRQPLR
ncbi:endonuclease domain-containing protein [Streptomyces sp. Ag109_O5-1]|uniref:endonuclease domain-containing protein n=1 Tax=Streptomyces sp. Ag109_O5-1 TaxID=1938851 RepID=UPI00162A6F4E|nr:endonuclease domain-containing protein [Streptomyces sp. Ag109_O5-1]